MRARMRLRGRDEDGQAVVELALVLPLLLIVVFALIDFGLAINQYNDETNLSNLAARAITVLGNASSSTPPTCGSSTTLTTYIQCQGGKLNSNLGAITVCTVDNTSPGSSWTVGDTISVKVHANFDWLRIVAANSGPSTAISTTATMRNEQAMTSTDGNYTWVAPKSTAALFTSC